MEASQSIRIASAPQLLPNTATSQNSVVLSAVPARTHARRLRAGVARRRWPASPVVQVQMKLEWYGMRAGVAWPAAATLREYGGLLEPHVHSAADALRTIVDLVERVRYGPRDLSSDECQRLLEASERVWAQLPCRPRRRRVVVEGLE